MRWGAILVAAGRGTRFGAPKQLVAIAGKPMLAWSLDVFAQISEITDIVITTEIEQMDAVREVARRIARGAAVLVIPGGATRQESVRHALGFVPTECGAILVHDGARPLVRLDDVRAGMRATKAGCAAILGTPVVDTIKVVPNESLEVRETLERSQLWAAQTPQFALAADLRSAHARAAQERIDATDDAMLLEQIGIRVSIVPSSGENLKVTLPSDRILAEAILGERSIVST